MTRLYVLVEGPSEEGFVDEVLGPHLNARAVWTYPIVVETSRDIYGRKRKGGGQWRRWKDDLLRLCKGQAAFDVRVTTMFDLYGLPKDFPELSKHAHVSDTRTRVQLLECAMATAIGDRRLIPYLQRHEFEALVFASINSLAEIMDPNEQEGVDRLRTLVSTTAPEDINDGKITAPSKRLLSELPTYRKTFHASLAIADTGLPTLRANCPRFDAWVTKLEALGEQKS
jgi:hypothetical protein